MDPAHNAGYTKNAEAFEDKLTGPPAEFSTGPTNCQRKDIVTSHAAFGYLAERSGMKQIAIDGPSPTKSQCLRDRNSQHLRKSPRLDTVRAETPVSPAIAQTVAREAGAKTATLDPIEIRSDRAAGKDSFAFMRAHLKALRPVRDVPDGISRGTWTGIPSSPSLSQGRAGCTARPVRTRKDERVWARSASTRSAGRPASRAHRGCPRS